MEAIERGAADAHVVGFDERDEQGGQRLAVEVRQDGVHAGEVRWDALEQLSQRLCRRDRPPHLQLQGAAADRELQQTQRFDELPGSDQAADGAMERRALFVQLQAHQHDAERIAELAVRLRRACRTAGRLLVIRSSMPV